MAGRDWASVPGRVREEPRMTRDVNHFRLVVAIFDEPQSLQRAVKALLLAGLTSDQLCLVAHADTLAALAQGAQGGEGHSAVEQLVSRIEAWPADAAAGSPQSESPLGATAGALRDDLVRLLHRSASTSGSDGALQVAQRPDFAEHLTGGAITVVVRSTTPAQQSVTTRTLLGQSSHRVKTYEFTSAP